ncbi:hypothetical protein [Haloferula rosea]|uniref:Uncharacterized protein n=1 Tax=Haloferula rosea TaxID=490093 RepID=A0A934VE88_9BACT|nr:hypothetical protein [Haloferula rosea]MBK1825796.1 hypothetical protein [Haloferula rosea]
MKKALALVLATASGIVLFIPDPIPLIDEATALLIFVSSLGALGINVSRFLPFLGKKVPKTKGPKEGPVVDV